MLSLLLPLVFVTAFMTPVFAQQELFGDVCRDNPDAAVCRDQQAGQGQTQQVNRLFGPFGVLTQAARLIVMVVGVVSVIIIIIGGLKYILANGDSAKITSARDTIIYALVGLVIALFAQGIISFVLTRI